MLTDKVCTFKVECLIKSSLSLCKYVVMPLSFHFHNATAIWTGNQSITTKIWFAQNHVDKNATAIWTGNQSITTKIWFAQNHVDKNAN